MSKFVFVYQLAGKTAMGSMDNWMKWYQENQKSFVDNLPFLDTACTVRGDSVEEFNAGEASPLIRAMDIIEAEDMAAAQTLAKTCPLAAETDGTVVVYEVRDMSGMDKQS